MDKKIKNITINLDEPIVTPETGDGIAYARVKGLEIKKGDGHISQTEDGKITEIE